MGAPDVDSRAARCAFVCACHMGWDRGIVGGQSLWQRHHLVALEAVRLGSRLAMGVAPGDYLIDVTVCRQWEERAQFDRFCLQTRRRCAYSKCRLIAEVSVGTVVPSLGKEHIRACYRSPGRTSVLVSASTIESLSGDLKRARKCSTVMDSRSEADLVP